MRKYQILLIVALVTLIASLSAFGGVLMSPMITEITLPPGTSYEDDITITNTGDQPMVVEARSIGFIAPEGVPEFLDPLVDDYSYSGRALLTLTPAAQTVQPGEAVLFHYKVSMPEDLDPYGGRYVAGIFRVQPPSNGGQVTVAAQVASLFLLSPGGDAAPHLAFEQISIYQKKNDPQTVVLSAKIANDGNLHIVSDQIWGMINVADEDGYIIDSFKVNTHTMLPGNSYTHREEWNAPDYLVSGTYQFRLTVLIFGKVGTEPQEYKLVVPVKLEF